MTPWREPTSRSTISAASLARTFFQVYSLASSSNMNLDSGEILATRSEIVIEARFTPKLNSPCLSTCCYLRRFPSTVSFNDTSWRARENCSITDRNEKRMCHGVTLLALMGCMPFASASWDSGIHQVFPSSLMGFFDDRENLTNEWIGAYFDGTWN